MRVPIKVIGMMLCGATMLAPRASAQLLRGKPQGPAQTPASNETKRRAPLKINLGPPKEFPKVPNPHAAMHDAAVIAVLQRQRQTADLQFAQMKAMQPLVAMPVRQAPQLPAGARVQAGSPGTLSKAGASPVAATGKPTDKSGSPSVKPTVAPFLESVVAACAMSGPDAMSIGRVSGEFYPATFTPIEKYNQYTITGCSFGPFDRDKVHVYIFGKGSFTGNFQPKLWTENLITVILDPALSGFLDQDNLTLVVQRADGKQASKSGFKFYAARGDAYDNPVPLKQLPADYAYLAPYDLFVTQYSASADEQQGISAQVSRSLIAHKDATNGNVYFDNQNEKAVPVADALAGLDGGMAPTDEFDLRKLQPSFVPVSLDGFYWMPEARSLCGAWDEQNHWTHLVGTWDFSWPTGNRIMVHSQTTICRDKEAFGRTNWAQQSQYALRVWVSGPRCIDPWTGQPDQTCIDNVRAAKSNLNKQ